MNLQTARERCSLQIAGVLQFATPDAAGRTGC
jgi:hypothetical protein